MEKLPKRENSKTLLKSNIISFDQKQQLILHQYEIKFTPQVTKQKQRYVSSLLEKHILKQTEIGAIRYYDHLYSTLDSLAIKPIYLSTQEDQWAINLTLTNSFKLGVKVEGSKISIQVIKSMITRTLSKNGFIQIGKSSTFINLKEKKKVEGMNIYQFQGYSYKINLMKQLIVIPSFKLVNSQSILQTIVKIYQSNSELSKDDKRKLVVERISGLNVMTNYGNGKNTLYKIKNLDFNHSILTPAMVGQMNLKTYYNNKYQIEIKDQKQPLLIAQPKSKSSEITILLIPQLCLSIGLGSSISKIQKAQITKKTTKSPQQVYSYNQKALKMFQQGYLGKTTDLEYKQCEVETLVRPFINVGNVTVDIDDNDSIKIFNKKIPLKKPVTIKFYHVKNQSLAREISNLMKSVCCGFGFESKIIFQQLNQGNFKEKQYLKMFNNDKFTHVILLPRNLQHIYSEIKLFSFKHQIISQVILQSKCSGSKNMFPIVGKIIIQIYAKNGIVMWSPSIDIKTRDKIMIIGINTQKSKGKRLISIVSSLNSNLSQFRSQLKQVDLKHPIEQQLTKIIKDCIQQYEKINQFIPKNIIVMKCEDSQNMSKTQAVTNLVWEKKIEQPFQTHICYISVDDKSIVRFFKQNKQAISNPPVGTIFQNSDSQFYLISQNYSNRLTKPIKYTILKEGFHNKQLIQQLIFGECFNYMNWTGSVQVPSCLQYGRKLLRMATTIGMREYISIKTIPYL